MAEGKELSSAEFKSDAAKIITGIATDKHKKLIAIRSTKKVLICGDFEDRLDGTRGPTKAMIELNKMFQDAKINSFMLNHVDTPLDHNSKEMIALSNSDVVILINGRGTGTIGETAISMIKGLGMKTIFLHKEDEISMEKLMSETEYTSHFPIKYSYTDDIDMKAKAFNYGKQLLNCICRNDISGGGINESANS